MKSKLFNRKNGLGFFALLFTFVMFKGVTPAFSSDAILIRKSGNVEVLFKGRKRFRRVRAGTRLSFGDTVQTRRGAKAQILFKNGNAILIKANAALKLSGSRNKIVANIPRGEFLIGIKKRLKRRQSFKVRTPAAIAAVRGTLFWGLSDFDLNTTYACFNRSIAITSEGKTIVLKAGQKTFIPYGKVPGKKEPANVPIEYLDTFAVDGSIEGFKDMIRK